MAEDYDDSSSSGEEIKARGKHANVPVIPSFDLNVALKALSEDNAQLSHILEQDEQNLRKARQKIVSSSRKNFILERELNEIDEKIKLLVKNRITVQEVMMSSNPETSNEKSSDDQNFLKTKRTLYEDMFYLLQTRPQYFAHAARTLQAKEIPSFVQTVVFDMYGDQYDTREERLLLSLFRIALQQELHHAVDKGSLLRANTAITQMLSAYARRGQGLSILKDILEEPLRNITSRKDLNLEINPTKVYSQMITDFETSTGQTSPLNKNITDEQAAQNVEVQKIIAQRSRELLNLADIILKRIIDGVESIPYGMRWICKQLGALSRNKFPDADRYQIGSLMGGYIYLRFFNPVIVTPDTVGFVQTKPSRVMRRNLILIAKVLQNLSNGLLFGEKETYMKGLNSFIEERMDPLQDYFDQLVNVDELDDVSQVDKYLEHTNSRSSMVQLSLNQIILIHSVLQKNIDKLAPDAADPIRDLIRRLGAPPEEVKKEENRVVALQLADRRKERMSTKFSAADIVSSKPTINPLTIQAKNLLLAVLKRLPIATNQSQLLPFLEDEKRRAITRGNSSLADNLTNVISMLCTLDNMSLLPKGVSAHDTFNQFLWGFAQESVSKAGRVKLLEKRSTIVNQALKSIENHHSYLQSRLELYKIYLDNVRQGQSQQQLMNKPNANKNMKITTPSKPAAPKIAKFTHFQLEEMGVVTRTNADVKKAVLKKCYYEFTQSSAGKFKVELHLNKGIDIKLLNKPIELALEELLRMQEHGELMMDIDYVTLNVNLLIHLLNTHFMGNK